MADQETNADLLVYVGDPMCSWCYGFGPALDAFVARCGLPLQIVVGGLRPYTRAPLDAGKRAEIETHWRHVEQLSGQTFGSRLLEQPGFVYDTEPACRAVVTMRALLPAQALAYFSALQRAFYREGHDITQAPVLAELAADLGAERAAFESAFVSEAMREHTREDFAQVQQWGIGGFPTLLLQHAGRLTLLASGFTPEATLSARLAQLRGSA